MTTPTVQEINDNIIAQLEAELGQTIPFLPKSFERVLAKVLAGLYVILYKYIGWNALQTFVSQASDQPTEINGKTIVPLEEWGVLIGVGRPVAATQAELTVDVTVNNQTGSIDAGEALLGANNGVTYLVVSSVLLNAPVVQVNIIASGDQTGGNGSGTIGNLSVGDSVSFVRPLDQVERIATVSGVVTTGADRESTAAYRARVQDRFRRRAQGGAPADYEQWAEEAAGVLNAYPYTSDCPGINEVFIESATEPDGIPTTAQLQAALDLIEFDVNGRATRRQLGALTNVLPITRQEYNVQINGLIVDNPVEVQANIQSALVSYFLQLEPFISGLSNLPPNDIVSRTTVVGVVSDVVGASNGQFISLVLLLGSMPINQQTLGKGTKAKLGTLTFT